MKKVITLFVIITLFTNYAKACTVCGCSASNQYLGILPQSKNSFVSLQYQFRAFTGIHHSEAGESGINRTTEDYHSLQLWGRHNLSKRVQLFAFIPYVINKHIENGIRSNINGIGDITILANYRLAGVNCTGKEWQHNLLLGGGVKLPTGKYDSYSVKYNEGLPNMQAGTSSYDFTINTNYTLQHKKTGINTDISYVVTTSNKDKYKFGNRLSAGLLAFHTITNKQIRIIPQMGLRYENAGSDYDNFSLRLKNDMSGGNQLFATVGVQVFYEKVGVNVMYHNPVVQHYASGMVNNKFKMESGFYLLF